MESLVNAYKGRSVFVTGHTGFKGSWLCEWLLALGAEVHGLALPPPTKPSLFSQLRLSKRIASHTIGDVRDLATVAAAMRRAKPDFVFHLAAQPLVRLSYEKPVETFETNVMGTVNVLEAVRRTFCAGKSKKRCSVCNYERLTLVFTYFRIYFRFKHYILLFIKNYIRSIIIMYYTWLNFTARSVRGCIHM